MKNDRIDAIIPLDATGCVIGEDLYFPEDGSAFCLSCMGSDRILIFDAETDQVIDEIQALAPDKPFIRYPHGMAGMISAVALKSGKTVATIDAFNEAGLKPESIMLLGQGGDLH